MRLLNLVDTLLCSKYNTFCFSRWDILIIYISAFFFYQFLYFPILFLLKVQIAQHRMPLFLFRLLFRNGAQISFRFAFLFGHLNSNGVNIPFRFAFLFPHLIPHLQKLLRRCSDILLSLVPQGLPAP